MATLGEDIVTVEVGVVARNGFLIYLAVASFKFLVLGSGSTSAVHQENHSSA